jgi:hypothetical protein
MFESLGKLLHESVVSGAIINRVHNSGYFLKSRISLDLTRPKIRVSDSMCGNKALSSRLDIDEFLSF